MNHFRLSAAFLILLTGTRAVSFGTALFNSGQQRRSNRVSAAPATSISVPHPVTFREVNGRGLLVDAWVNSAGPFTLAVDTGAGATILSPRVAAEAHLNVSSGRGPSIAGLSGAVVAANEAVIQTLAIGDSQNYLPTKTGVIVSSGLPPGLDGLLDPNDAFGPLGYVIDISGRELSAFDPRQGALSSRDQPRDGAIVSWLQEGNNHRPFVMLDNGDRALIDTGSSLGLVVRDRNPASEGRRAGAVHDVGGRVSARRGTPQTVAIGSLVLRNVPTDFISGATADAPTMLGLNALRPFRLTFDPLHRLIEIVEHDRGYGRR
jgi:hypothetical protein